MGPPKRKLRQLILPFKVQPDLAKATPNRKRKPSIEDDNSAIKIERISGKENVKEDKDCVKSIVEDLVKDKERIAASAGNDAAVAEDEPKQITKNV
ncbi:hypothetical protein RP20_CCG021812 [Aedes albopictus]|nr:hypothetical protein RP20_CCG021812 [Aedes albopictus]